MKNNFCDMLDAILQERLADADAAITLEFSTAGGDIDPEKIISTRKTLAPRWSLNIAFCETCYLHNSETPFHIEILEA